MVLKNFIFVPLFSWYCNLVLQHNRAFILIINKCLQIRIYLCVENVHTLKILATELLAIFSYMKLDSFHLMRLLRSSSSRSTWQAWVPRAAFPYDVVNPPSAERRVHTDHKRMVCIPCVYDCELLDSMTGWMLSHILGTYAVSRLQSKNKTIKVTSMQVRGVSRTVVGNNWEVVMVSELSAPL